LILDIHVMVNWQLSKQGFCWPVSCDHTGLEIATDTVANATNIFSLATKNSGLVVNVATRFFYDLDLN